MRRALFPLPVSLRRFGPYGFLFDALTLSSLADGAAVTSWLDSSGNNYTATQATGANQPTFKTAILGGRPVVRFDGVDDFLTVAAGFQSRVNAVAGLTLFVVCQTTAPGTSKRPIAINTNASPTVRAGLFREQTAAGQMSVGGRRTDGDVFAEAAAAAALTAGAWSVDVGVLDYNAARASFYKNGSVPAVNAAFQTAGVTSATDAQGVTIGATAGGNFSIAGDLAIAGCILRVLNPSEVAKLTALLGRTYKVLVT